MMFDGDGTDTGNDVNSPISRNGEMVEVIRDWMEAMLPTRVALIGDGDLHMEIRGDVDCLVGCGDEIPSGC